MRAWSRLSEALLINLHISPTQDFVFLLLEKENVFLKDELEKESSGELSFVMQYNFFCRINNDSETSVAWMWMWLGTTISCAYGSKDIQQAISLSLLVNAAFRAVVSSSSAGWRLVCACEYGDGFQMRMSNREAR